MQGYRAEIVADSTANGHRLTTMAVTFPRLVLAEFNTHRAFSRNSASSRAIPVSKQVHRVMSTPFVPKHWGANQSGMQAENELDSEQRMTAVSHWFEARDAAVMRARKLLDCGVHKQLTNRLLEPFMWQTVIVTATEWGNFFALRANKMAQPEIRVIAEMMLEKYTSSVPHIVPEGEWHLPYILEDERQWVEENPPEARQVSAARCARVSYLTHEGKRDFQADLTLYERLVSGGHMSPLEHVATPFTQAERTVRARMSEIAMCSDGLDRLTITQMAESVEFNGNFRGWTQLRKLVPNEHDFGAVERS